MDNQTYRNQKAALTRAINSGDPDRVVNTVIATVRAWQEDGGSFPDDWHRWQRALDDTQHWSAPRMDITAWNF